MEFTAEKFGSRSKSNRTELIKQIETLQHFYYDLGFDTTNIRTIFSLTLSYLKGKVNKLIVKTFFEVLMTDNRLNTEKEVDLLNCFDSLIEELETKNIQTLDLHKENKKQNQQLNFTFKIA